MKENNIQPTIRKKRPRKDIGASLMCSVTVELSKDYNAVLQAQQTTAIEFYNRVLYLLRNNYFYHEHQTGKTEQRFDADTLKYAHKHPTKGLAVKPKRSLTPVSVTTSPLNLCVNRIAILGIGNIEVFSNRLLKPKRVKTLSAKQMSGVLWVFSEKVSVSLLSNR